MQTTLFDNPNLFKKTNTLIEGALNYPENKSFCVDFYPVMNKNNFKNNHIIFDAKTNTVIAHIGLNFRNLGKSLPVALLGGIAVNKHYRGQGYFRSLLKSVLNKYENHVGLFILWSDLENLYEKFGFFDAGCFLDQKDPGTIPAKYIKTKFQDLNPNDFKQIKKIYSSVIFKKYLTFERLNSHWEIIKKINSTDLYIMKENGLIQSYFCINKGGDLSGVVHEIGYLAHNEDQTMKDLKGLRIWKPSLGENSEQLRYLGKFKIGNISIFNQFLNQKGLNILSSKELIKFSFRKNEYNLSHQDFLQSIFGPMPFSEFSKGLFFSGLDSI